MKAFIVYVNHLELLPTFDSNATAPRDTMSNCFLHQCPHCSLTLKCHHHNYVCHLTHQGQNINDVIKY